MPALPTEGRIVFPVEVMGYVEPAALSVFTLATAVTDTVFHWFKDT